MLSRDFEVGNCGVCKWLCGGGLRRESEREVRKEQPQVGSAWTSTGSLADGKGKGEERRASLDVERLVTHLGLLSLVLATCC